MFRKITYPILTAMLVLAGYLNFSSPASAAPTAGDDFGSTAIDLPIVVNVLQNDSPLGGTIDAIDLYPTTIGVNETSTTTPAGTWVVQGNNTVLYTPAPAFSGTAIIPYVVVDSFGARSLPANISVDVESRPFLRIYHGAVAKSSLSMLFDPVNVPTVSDVGGTCPRISTVNSNILATGSFRSNLKDVEFNNEYTGMIVIENVGNENAFDVGALMIHNQYLESPFMAGINECVMKGDGTLLIPGIDYSGNVGSYSNFAFNTASPALSAYSPTSGENIIVITYDIRWPFSKTQQHDVNITNYATTSGGPDVNTDYDVSSFSAFLKPNAFNVNQTNTIPTLSISGLTIGQIVEYQVEIELPPMASSSGSPTTTVLRNILPEGMIYYDNNTGVLTDYVTATIDGAIQNIFPTFTFVSDQVFEFSFSEFLINDTSPHSILLTIPAVILDTATNTASTSAEFINTVELIERNGIINTLIGTATSSTKLLQEPALVLRNLSGTSTNASGTVQYLFELFHQDGLSDRSDAFDVEFYLQTNGPGLTPLTITNPVTDGLPAATTTIGSLFLSWPSIPSTYTSSSPITISFTGTLVTPTTSATTLAYPIGLSFSSLSGSVPGPLSSLSALSRERSYAGTSTYSAVYAFSGIAPTSTPPGTSTPGCIGACGGSYNNPGCMDPLALNYDKWVTSNNGSCKYPITSPTSTPPTISPTSTPPTVPPIVSPAGTSTPTITYIPKAKRQIILQITGPLESIQTKLRKNALKVSLSEGNSITIPHIGTKKPVLQLPNLDPLLNELWMLPWGSTPDKGNNTVLVGHSYNQQKGKQWPNVLFDLDKVKVGEQITLDWKGKKYTYEVIDNKQFDAKDVYIEDDTKESILTIYGCGKYTTKYRQVVRALLVSVE